jgi:hypothetical protein
LCARPVAGDPFTRPTGLLLRRGRSRSGALARFVSALEGESDTTGQLDSAEPPSV